MKIETLAELIAQVESHGMQYAVRFEPAHNPHDEFVEKMRTVAKCSRDTARVLCAMSWGLYQIMGDELIALGLAVSPLVYIQAIDIQLDFFNRYCLADHLNMTLADVLADSVKRRFFARLYNGPGNVDAYAQRMVDAAKQNGLETVG